MQNPLGTKGVALLYIGLATIYRALCEASSRTAKAAVREVSSLRSVKGATLPCAVKAAIPSVLAEQMNPLRVFTCSTSLKRKDVAMKKIDALINLIISDIESKDILEVACGTADFSISAARFASSISCIDLDDSRLNQQIKQTNIHFQIMDASKMDYPDNAFDTIVLYNSFFHIQSHWNEIEHECKRVVKHEGVIYIVGTWKLDTNLIEEIFSDDAKWKDGFLIVKMKK